MDADLSHPLAAVMSDRGLSLAGLADLYRAAVAKHGLRSGADRNLVWKWKTGRRTPTAESQRYLADALGVSRGVLAEDEWPDWLWHAVTTKQMGFPNHLHVANVLRDRISSGELAPGQQLPSDDELSELFGYDRATVRRGIRQLRLEGLIHTEHGKGSFVRAVRLVRHEILGMHAEMEHVQKGTMPDRGLFELATGTPSSAVEVAIDYQRMPATAELAEAFNVPEGTELLRRTYTFFVDGKPHQISSSYVLYSVVEGTVLTDPANERPGRGTIAQLKEVGVIVEHAKIEIQARMPTPVEMAQLGMSEGTPIMIDRRASYAAGRVVVVSDTVSPGDQIMYGIDVRLDNESADLGVGAGRHFPHRT